MNPLARSIQPGQEHFSGHRHIVVPRRDESTGLSSEALVVAGTYVQAVPSRKSVEDGMANQGYDKSTLLQPG
jgi:hypothetical protein